jgi:four helix bundle protein
MAIHDLEDRLVQFSSSACQLGQRLPRTPAGQHASLQLIRSSTSTFANYGEVQAAESRRDFIHKLRICLKELRETRTWLKFIRKMDLASGASLEAVMRECEELLAILATSIRTAQRNGMRSGAATPANNQ